MAVNGQCNQITNAFTKNMRMSIHPGVLRSMVTGYFVLSFYTFGALIIENDVNYQTWMAIGEAEFPAYHRKLQELLLPLFMIPLALQLLLSILLLVSRQSFMAKPVIVIIILLNLYIILISFLVQVPIHNELNLHKNSLLLNQLIFTHQRLRLPAEILLFLVNVVQLFKIIRQREINMG